MREGFHNFCARSSPRRFATLVLLTLCLGGACGCETLAMAHRDVDSLADVFFDGVDHVTNTVDDRVREARYGY